VTIYNKVPLVSIIIPTYNRSAAVSEAIDSVLEQTFKDREIIVVDDGSTDNTKELLLLKYGDKIVYVYQANSGVSSARNTGIKTAKGKYIAFLDSDDIWLPDKMAKQIELFETLPDNVGLVYCSVIHETQGQRTIRWARLRGDVFRERLLNDDRAAIYIPSVMIRRECFEKIGLFDEFLRRAEDRDLYLRLTRNYLIDFIEKPLVLIRRVDKSLTMDSHAMSGIFYILNKLFDDPTCPQAIRRLRNKAYAARLLEFMCECYSSNKVIDTWRTFLRAFIRDPKSIKVKYILLFIKAPLKSFLQLTGAWRKEETT
jgi:glycosyltransferase involved in cell wall biosynthesis